jgi:hypothetical protein
MTSPAATARSTINSGPAARVGSWWRASTSRATDVAVRPNGPALLDLGPVARDGFRHVGPQRRLELPAVLIDGDRVTCDVDQSAEVRIVELVLASGEEASQAVGDPEAADRVEDPDEAEAHKP